MFRKTITGLRSVTSFPRGFAALLAASLTAGALTMMSSASATPTFVKGKNISGTAALPHKAVVAMSEGGDSVAAWIRDGRIMAATADHGDWSAAAYVTAPGQSVSDPAVVMNDQDEAVVSWVGADADDDVRLAAARISADGTIGTPTFLSSDDWFPITSVPDVGLAGNGTFFAAYEDGNGGNVHEVRVTSWTAAGVTDTDAVSDLTAAGGSIAVNDAGQALVAFHDDINGSEVIQTRRFNPIAGTWTAVKSVGLVGTYSVATDAALDNDGYGTVVYDKQDGEGHYRAMANVSKPDATVGGASFVSPAGYDVAYLSISQNKYGEALVTYDRVGNGNYIGYITRNAAGTWSTSKVVEGALSNLTRPRAVLSDSGFQLIAWDDDEHQKAVYRKSSFADWTTYDSGSVKFRSDETGVGTDNQGNVVLTGIIHSADPTQGFVTGKVLDTAGPVNWLTAPTLNTIGTTVPVAWKAGDRFSSLGKTDVRVRTAVWNGSFAGFASAADDSDASELDFAGKGGRTYCFSSRTLDGNGNSGAFSPERCTTTPLDDGALMAAGGFSRVHAAPYYNGTYSTAKTKGATLKLSGVKAGRLALVVSKVGTGGTIEVFFHGDSLGSYSLKGSGNKQVLDLGTFDAVETGTVVVKVTSANGKTVRIDGLIAAK